MSFINELKKERKALTERLNAVNLLLNSYGEIPTKIDNTEEEEGFINFDLSKELKKSSTPQKLLLVLKENARFMKIREIAKFIETNIGGEEDEWTIKLSRTTGKLKKLNKITSYRIGVSNTNVFWGSPNWLDNNGNIKKGYEVKENITDKNQGNLLMDL